MFQQGGDRQGPAGTVRGSRVVYLYILFAKRSCTLLDFQLPVEGRRTMGRLIATVQRKKAYPKPSNALAQYFWRWKMWVDSTFALGMLEPWENFLVGKCLLSTPLYDLNDSQIKLLPPLSRVLRPCHWLAGGWYYSLPTSPPSVPVQES